MTIFESSMSARHFGRQLELPLLIDLGRILTVLLWVYAVLRVQDLYHRGALHLAFQWRYEADLFWLEMGIGLLLPLLLLARRQVRSSANGLYLVSVLVVAGFVTNRLNVSITGMEASAGLRYVPKWTEVAVTASIVALGIVLFGFATRHLSIFAAEEERTLPSREAARAVSPHAAD